MINPKIPKLYITSKIYKNIIQDDLSLIKSKVTPLKFHALLMITFNF